MARYKIEAFVEGDRIDRVREHAKRIFGEGLRMVEKEERNKSRADRLSDAEALWDEAKNIVQELQEEMENWHDNMPENLKDSGKGEEVETAKDALQELLDALDQADFSGVEFPGMY